MGLRDLPADRRVLDDTAETTMLRTREPVEALEQLFALDRQRVFLEGGPTLAAAFLTAGLVDEVVAYVAPMFLGSGLSSVGDLGIETMADASRWTLKDVSTVGIGEDRNVRLVLAPPVPSSAPSDTTCSARGK
jgi:diaminohydroxyphosphoribosylaminopyrimidine deaminase/5-amino-6-(5-phosphoribosylamino)uracil reductase